MTPQEIRAAIAASPSLLAQAQTAASEADIEAIAAALSVGRTEVYSRMTSARGLAELMPGGPLAAEAALLKLEGARDNMLASQDAQTRLFGSLLKRQLGFLAGDGLDFGSAALRSMLDQFAALSILTTSEVAALKSVATRPAPVPASAVKRAIYADDGALLV